MPLKKRAIDETAEMKGISRAVQEIKPSKAAVLGLPVRGCSGGHLQV